MKKKLKKAIKKLIDPTIKPDHESLYDIVEEYENRLANVELENNNMIVRLANLEARLDNHDHNGES